MICRALVLVALMAVQEDHARWVEALGDEDLARREEAWAALRKAGLAALPAIEKAFGSRDREVAELARRLAQTIRDDAQRERVLGPVKRVTLSLKGRPFGEALREIDRQTGFTTSAAPAIEDRAIALDLRECSYLEALDRLCEAHGAAHLVATTASKAKRLGAWEDDHELLELQVGPTVKKPTIYQGPFRIRIEGIALHRPPQTQLAYSVAWQPNVRPVVGALLLMDEAVDDRGTDLLTTQNRNDTAKAWASPGTSYRGLWTEYSFRFDPLPSLDAEKLFRFRGTARIYFVLEKPTMEFDLKKDVGVKREAGPYVFELRSLKITEGRAHVVVRVTRQDGDRARFWMELGPMRVLDAEGKDLPYSSAGGSYGDGWNEFDKNLQLGPGQSVATLRLRPLVRVFEHDIPFDFRDVPLPRW